MRTLVTGVCGFAGSYLAKHLLECGDEVLGTVYAKTDIKSSTDKYSKHYLDITDGTSCAKLISEYKPEAIFHLAGLSFVPDAEDNFSYALLTNVAGTENILRVCHISEINPVVVVVSSGEIYGKIGAKDLPLTEHSEIKPANNYSLSKAMAELVVQRYAQFGNFRAVTMRSFNHTGPGQNDRFVAPSFSKQLAQIAHKKAPPSIKVGNLEAKRDFSDVRDIVRAYRLGGIRGKGVYNLGSGKSHSVREILDMLIEISDLEVEVKVDDSRYRPLEVPEVVTSIEKAKLELGWKPQYSLRETLEDLYKYWYDRVSQ